VAGHAGGAGLDNSLDAAPVSKTHMSMNLWHSEIEAKRNSSAPKIYSRLIAESDAAMEGGEAEESPPSFEGKP